MSDRKLATIRRIKELLPIKGADLIELAIVDGWQVVTQKGQHAAGDLVVFYEIDSWLPAEDPRYASFEERFTNWNGKRGMRLKSIKLRKQLSQGLIMPVRAFEELSSGPHGVAEGMDVTDILKIVKWEATEPNGPMVATGAKTRPFPYFLRKTDQERVQNYGHIVERALTKTFEVSVKKDGSSMTVFRVDPTSPYYKDAKILVAAVNKPEPFYVRWYKAARDYFNPWEAEPVFGICSRNVLLPLEGNSNFHVAAGPILAILAEHGESVAIQGELVAPDIQGNYEKVSGVEFHCFDMFDIDAQKYLLPEARREYADKFGIPHVTVVDKGTLRSIIQYKEGEDVVAKLLTYASGEGDNPGVMREGVVFKCDTEDLSFKAVSNEYLLATGK